MLQDSRSHPRTVVLGIMRSPPSRLSHDHINKKWARRVIHAPFGCGEFGLEGTRLKIADKPCDV
jgi:hypothetical protein